MKVVSNSRPSGFQAVENHENNRAEIQSALADIPRKLEAIQRSFEMRIRWPILHRCADQILLSIFVVLERIIDKLSMSTLRKLFQFALCRKK